jgi:hypothetical protein
MGVAVAVGADADGVVEAVPGLGAQPSISAIARTLSGAM